MTTPAASAATTRRQLEIPTGGVAPMSTSRRIPPPRPVAHASTSTPKMSKDLRIADSPPDSAAQNTAPSSRTSSIGNSITGRIIPADPGTRHTEPPAPRGRSGMALSGVQAHRRRAGLHGVGGFMNELELVRLHEDGETLVLAGADGARFTLPIDDALRAAVRRDRTQLEQLRAQAPGVLPVREIQSQLRAGHSAREVAEKAGIPIEQVRRFEGPVLAEQEFVVEQVRKNRLGHDESSPTLGELVTERLTARGVEPE